MEYREPRPSRALLETGVVAVASAALAFADGGYSTATVATATFIVWLAAAAAWIARPHGHALSSQARWMAVCLGGLAVLSALSMAWANDAGRAFDAAIRAGGYAGLFLLAAALIPRTGARAWLQGIAAGIAIVLLAALASRCDPALFGGGDRSLVVLIPSAVGRLSYPLGYWNGLAALLALGWTLTIWIAAGPPRRAIGAAATATLPAYVLGLYLTSSRGGVAVAVAGTLALGALWADGRRRLVAVVASGVAVGILLVLAARVDSDFLNGLDTHNARVAGVLMAVAVVAAGAACALLAPRAEAGLAPLGIRRPRGRTALAAGILVCVALVVAVNPSARIEQFKQPTAGPAGSGPGGRSLVSAGGSGRYQFWSVALEAFADNPAGGVGAGNYELYWSAHPKEQVAVRNAHSLYLETLAELGPAGLALLAGIAAAAALAWRRRRGPPSPELAAALALVVVGALSAAIEWTWQLPAVFAPVVVALAILASAPAPAPAAERSWPRRAAVLALAAVLGWATAWAAGVSFLSAHKLDAGREAAARGDVDAAIGDAGSAARLEPFSAEPQIQLGLAYRQAREPGQAAAAFRRAVELAPGDWRPHLVYGKLAAAQGEHGVAKRELGLAQSLSPIPLPGVRLAAGSGKPTG